MIQPFDRALEPKKDVESKTRSHFRSRLRDARRWPEPRMRRRRCRAREADRFTYMVDYIVGSLQPRGWVDIRVGEGRRGRWSDEAKARVVAESYAPGAVASEVGRRHDISPAYLFL
jgi:hypothetical protein